MRRPLFIAMIALLLLRGWVGDAMASSMALSHLQQNSPAIEFIASTAHPSMAGDHFDHEMGSEPAESMVHVAAAPADCAGLASGQATDPMTPDATGHCESCAACQACHTVALSPLATRSVSLTMSPALPHSPTAPFASAVTALGQKPPIS